MLAKKWVLPTKKTTKYSERCHLKRINYLQALRKLIIKGGKDKIVYVDESGFELNNYRPYAWSMKGRKAYGDKSGVRSKRTNLIAAKRGKELLAPYLYEQTTTSQYFNQWLEHSLVKELKPGSTVIMDNAAFHRKDSIREILKKHGHQALFLPPYSPDFNPIEQDFAIMKKKMIYGEYTALDELIKKYGNILE